MSHYYAKSGVNSALGMEMSGNGNMQTLYAFMRGAGRQYAVPIWSSISQFTRFGYKRQDCVQAANTSDPCRDDLCLNDRSQQTDGGTYCGTCPPGGVAATVAWDCCSVIAHQWLV